MPRIDIASFQRRARWGLCLLVVGVVFSLSLARSRAAGDAVSTDRSLPSKVVYPEQRVPLSFSHTLHAGKLQMDCVDCHTGVETSSSALDNNLPTEAVCLACHPIDRREPNKASSQSGAPAACVRCHPGAGESAASIARVQLPSPRLKFSHRSHLARGTACSACHGDLVAGGVELATRRDLPKMATCLGCHDGKKAPSACKTCHISGAGGTLTTSFGANQILAPSSSLGGAAHGLDFLDRHGAAANAEQRLCASCHKKDYCVDCHNGVRKPMQYHVGDYRALHAVDARRDPASCEGCHRSQSFCVGCHSRSGVASDGKGSEFGLQSTGQGVLFHPQGWYDPAGGRSANHHAFEAQRNIRQCVSCHRESFCQRCHSAQPGSMRVNPHPRNWVGSRRCRALLSRAPRMCTRCHVDASELSCSAMGL